MRNITYFAFTTQPDTQRVDIWASWPAKPPFISRRIDMLTEIFYNWSKLKAPKPDSKTPKIQQAEKNGERVPPTKAEVPPLGF